MGIIISYLDFYFLKEMNKVPKMDKVAKAIYKSRMKAKKDVSKKTKKKNNKFLAEVYNAGFSFQPSVEDANIQNVLLNKTGSIHVKGTMKPWMAEYLYDICHNLTKKVDKAFEGNNQEVVIHFNTYNDDIELFVSDADLKINIIEEETLFPEFVTEAKPDSIVEYKFEKED